MVEKRVLEWNLGERYYAVTCHHCGWQFPFAPVHEKLPDCPIQIVCLECDRTGHYCQAEFQQVEAK